MRLQLVDSKEVSALPSAAAVPVNVEIFMLPPGATLVLPCTSGAPADAPVQPEAAIRYLLIFENYHFQIASGERYTLNGTVQLPGEDGAKPLEVPCAFLQIGIPEYVVKISVRHSTQTTIALQ